MKNVLCITCPIGCRVLIEEKDGEYIFSGNKCARGAEFAMKEITSPVRSLTTTVRTGFPEKPVLSVRTNGEVPKSKIKDIIKQLSCIIINKDTNIGDVVIAGVCGTGCDVIATDNIKIRRK